MTVRVGPIDASSLERSVQLIHRSNQFNLTTRRRSTAEVQVMLDDDAWVTCTASLRDRFGDNGLIGVVLASVEADLLDIDTWLMSCRVLKRGVEQFVLNHLAALARARGLAALRGEYIPTAKNALVRDHYEKLGFARLGGDDSGRTTWILRLDDGWTPIPTFITEAHRDGLNTR